MDEQQFDEVSRGIARLGSRRGIVRAGASGLLAALLVAPAGREASAKCVKPGGSCRKKNGKKPKCCAGTTCTNGRCRCPEYRKACGGACIDPYTDEQNCGECEYTCPSSQNCVQAQCCKTSGPVDPNLPCCYGSYCNPPGQNCTCIS